MGLGFFFFCVAIEMQLHLAATCRNKGRAPVSTHAHDRGVRHRNADLHGCVGQWNRRRRRARTTQYVSYTFSWKGNKREGLRRRRSGGPPAIKPPTPPRQLPPPPGDRALSLNTEQNTEEIKRVNCSAPRGFFFFYFSFRRHFLVHWCLQIGQVRLDWPYLHSESIVMKSLTFSSYYIIP